MTVTTQYATAKPLPATDIGAKASALNFCNTFKDSFPSLTIIAEDLGDIPQSVLDLRDKCGLAGMKVVQFAFDGNDKNLFLPQNFEEHCVAYLGTHDNDTTQGWWDSLDDNARSVVLRFTGLENGEHIAHNLIKILAESRAELVVYSMQDISEQDTTYRMNIPGTLGCWKYMAKSGDFSAEKAVWLADLTENAHPVSDQWRKYEQIYRFLQRKQYKRLRTFWVATRWEKICTTLRVWAPNAKDVSVVGDFNNWLVNHDRLQLEDGIWQITVEAREGDCYKFAITTQNGNVLYQSRPLRKVRRSTSQNGKHSVQSTAVCME